MSTVSNSGTADERARRNDAARDLFPEVTSQTGCLGGMILDDPASGLLRVVVFWATAEAMIAAADHGVAFREKFAAAIGIAPAEIDVQLHDVGSFDLSLVPFPDAGVDPGASATTLRATPSGSGAVAV